MLTEYKDLTPVSKKGFGLAINHYVSGRISAAVASHGGLTSVRYNGAQDIKKGEMLEASAISGFNKLARLQIIIDDAVYFPEFNEVQHFPFGFSAECVLGTVHLRHELVLDRDVLMQRVWVLSNPGSCSVRARLLIHGHLWVKKPGRSFTGWSLDEVGRLRSVITDEDDGQPKETELLIGASQPLRSHQCREGFKNYLETTAVSDVTVFYLAFNTAAPLEHCSERMDRKIEEYRSDLSDGLRFDTGDPVVDSALSNCVPMISNLAVGDCPGAIKASQSYWVWGWDSMVHAEAYLWSGQTEVVRNMLDFYREYADPELGVAHAMNSDFSFRLAMAPSAQCLYTVMLCNYYAATGDEATLERHLPFAREIVAQAGQVKSRHNCLSVGLGFYPDHPQELEQTGDDLSIINNSLYLQALEGLDQLCGDYGEECAAVRADMENVLWDGAQGYWIDSVSEDDLTPRQYYPLYGQLYVSPHGSEPKAESVDQIAHFLRKHFRFEQGLYMFPPSMPGFMADGNQLGAYYPSVDRYYWNIMNRVGCCEASDEFERIVSYFWREHTYPEGLTHETVNADPATDNPGGKQAFAAKGWFCDAIELNLGLKVFADGFRLNPLPCEKSFQVRNLVLRGKRIDIERVSDENGSSICLNGETLNELWVTWEQLHETNVIRLSVSPQK
ncbi:hypothetical protein [Coraliomargarita parva]|uniref:hypothetical protein n=1 Tax=Coraliomargarita parva TaxID=3014050 RepID=UPI0022B341EA|nr:hypothetical protein [Coraliomargarita parva]